MSGIATLTMLLSRYVMKVASPTATQGPSVLGHVRVSYTSYMYDVQETLYDV